MTYNTLQIKINWWSGPLEWDYRIQTKLMWFQWKSHELTRSSRSPLEAVTCSWFAAPVHQIGSDSCWSPVTSQPKYGNEIQHDIWMRSIHCIWTARAGECDLRSMARSLFFVLFETEAQISRELNDGQLIQNTCLVLNYVVCIF